MLTIKAEIQRDKLRQDGSYNVRIRFTKDRKVKRISTSLFVTKADLTDKFTIREAYPALSHDVYRNALGDRGA